MAGPQYPYTLGVPAAAQKIAATQNPILNNFQSINEYLNVDHIGFTDPSNYGQHNQTSFVFQGSDPSTSSTQMALYAKTTSTSNGAEIFYRYPSNGTIVQLTGGGAGGSSSSTSNGYSYIGTTLMQWGLSTGITSGNNTISFNIPFTTSVYIVQYTPASTYTITLPGAYTTSYTLNNFVLNVPSVMSSTIYWFALGV